MASLPFRRPPQQTSAEVLEVPFSQQQPIYAQYLASSKPSSRRNSIKKLNVAMTSMLQWATTPLTKRRSSQTASLNELKTVRSENDVREDSKKVLTARRTSTVSLSPRFQRRIISQSKSRSSSSDSFAQTLAALHVKNELRSSSANNIALAAEESRSRKTSTKSNLVTVIEGTVLVKSQNPTSILYGKTVILEGRGVPIWIGPVHSTPGQPTLVLPV